MVAKFVLNAKLHHVGISLKISSNEGMKYEMDENDHHAWLDKGSWYNTSICLKLHGSMFEYFISHARSDRYNFMCSLVEHDNNQLMNMIISVLEIFQYLKIQQQKH